MRNQGFTLIEILAVAAILALVALLATLLPKMAATRVERGIVLRVLFLLPQHDGSRGAGAGAGPFNGTRATFPGHVHGRAAAGVRGAFRDRVRGPCPAHGPVPMPAPRDPFRSRESAVPRARR